MGIADFVVMTLVIAGAVLLLYRSLWKKQGHCPGCDATSCVVKSVDKKKPCL